MRDIHHEVNKKEDQMRAILTVLPCAMLSLAVSAAVPEPSWRLDFEKEGVRPSREVNVEYVDGIDGKPTACLSMHTSRGRCTVSAARCRSGSR